MPLSKAHFLSHQRPFPSEHFFNRETRLVYFAEKRQAEKGKESMLINVMGNRMEELKEADDTETLAQCREAMKTIEKPIETDNDVIDAIAEIGYLNERIKTLEKGGVLPMDLPSDESRYGVFFREDVKKRIAGTMVKPDYGVTIISGERLRMRALENWEKFGKKLWRQGRKRWENYMKAAEKGHDATEAFRDQLNQFSEEELKATEEAEEEAPERDIEQFLKVEEKRLRKELEEKNLSNRLTEDQEHYVLAVFREARERQANTLEKYIRDEFKKVYDAYEKGHDQNPALWKMDDIETIRRALDERREEWVYSPENLRPLAEAVKDLQRRTQAVQERYAVLDSPEAIREARRKLAYLKRLTDQVTDFDEFFGEAQGYAAKKQSYLRLIHPGDSSKVDRRSQEAIAFIAKLDEVEAILNDPGEHPDGIVDAINLINNEYARFKRAEKRLLRHDITERLEDIRSQLDDMDDPGEILQFVKKTFGRKNIKLLSRRKFNKKYGRLTQKGNMVVTTEGDDWTIFINKQAFQKKEPKVVEDLKTQIVHELRHLEYDENARGQRQQWEKLIQAPNWNEIKTAFVERNPNTVPPHQAFLARKFPPGHAFTAGDWKDKDVIDELYAMQDNLREKDSVLADLIKATGILSGGAGAAVTSLSEYRRKKRERGAATADEMDMGMGMDMGEGGGAAPGEPIGFTDESPDAEERQFQLIRLKDRAQAAKQSEYISYIPQGKELMGLILDALEQSPTDEVMNKADTDIGEVENDITTLHNQVKAGKSINPLRLFWINTRFLAIGDFVELGKQIYDYFDRRHKRNTLDAASRLGEAIFEKVPFMDGFAADSTANKEKAELEWVNEWKNRLENKDAWELLSMIDSLAEKADPSKDQLKAIMRILSEKGRIDWRQPGLWKVLNKLQSKERFKENDPFLLYNPAALRQKLMSAYGAIWDYDEFNNQDNKNTSSYESKKKEYIDAYDKMQGQLDARLKDLLALHRQGREADPIEYEAIMEYAIINGKSHAENIMFHFMAGMASGLLSPDRGVHLDKYLNEWPPLEFFTDHKPPYTQRDFQNMCMLHFGKEYRQGHKEMKGEFHNFFWTVIQNKPRVIERVEKSTSERKWDHDWARSIGANGGADTADRFLRGRSGQKETKPTAVQNAYVGCLQWLEENARKGGESWDKNLARQLGWAAMAEGIMESVAYKKEFIYTRKESFEGNKIARETFASNHAGDMARNHRKRIQQVLDTIDPIFFPALRDKAAVEQGEEGKPLADRLKAHLQANYGTHPDMPGILEGISRIDDLFKNLQHIVNIIVEMRPDRARAAINVLVDRNGRVRDL